jgi:predicted amidophosphoribosyltransferase
MAKTVKKDIVQKKASPHCPYCDVEMMAVNQPICQACQVTIQYCPHCGHPLPKGEKECSSCGY